jgi:amidohydrolase
MEKEVQEKIHAEIRGALEVARALGGDYDLKIEIGYPPLYNDAGVAALIREAAVEVLGTEQVRPPGKDLGAEDFGFFSAVAPGAMFYVGCRIEGDERRHHSPHFDVDEACLPVGAAVMTAAVLRCLNGG